MRVVGQLLAGLAIAMASLSASAANPSWRNTVLGDFVVNCRLMLEVHSGRKMSEENYLRASICAASVDSALRVAAAAKRVQFGDGYSACVPMKTSPKSIIERIAAINIDAPSEVSGARLPTELVITALAVAHPCK